MKIKVYYDGKYPTLCGGSLSVQVENDLYKFPDHCMVPGGSCYFTDEWDEVVTQGPWSLSEWPLLFPEELKQPVLDAINEQVTWGNCGGCI